MVIKLRRALAKLLKPGEPILLGISGGPDSVALLHALVSLGWRPHLCHLNHRWRGAASDADERFVRRLASELGLPITVSRVKTGRTEDAARRARLAFFERVARKTGIRTLLLAHTADDQVETFLLRLLRGAGPSGLAGMWPERQLGKLRVVRPMLEVTRAEVLQYLQTHGLEWREDLSNVERRYLRNRIRHELLPLLEREYNPRIREVLWRTAEILRAEAAGEPAAVQRRLIRRVLGTVGFQQVEQLRKQLTQMSEPQPAKRRLRLEERFDADALGDCLEIRTWRPGDRFQPLGMRGHKKLQDFFVDEKVPRAERGRVPLLCAADGRIAWVVGYRIAEPFKVTPRTRRVLRIRFQVDAPGGTRL